MAGLAVLIGGRVRLGLGLEPQALAGAVGGKGVSKVIMRRCSWLVVGLLGMLALLEG